MDQAACDKPLINEVTTNALFSNTKKCATKIRRDSMPHSCGTCHAMAKDGTRCPNTADKKKGVYCSTHLNLEK